ncbi:hypothetical protein, partial [Staphylococcus aureus]|uniref:hypothetical protein n=1 Tax=Staphylococcus aureus TaxID=1280 RepID=UPI0036E11340
HFDSFQLIALIKRPKITLDEKSDLMMPLHRFIFCRNHTRNQSYDQPFKKQPSKVQHARLKKKGGMHLGRAGAPGKLHTVYAY